MERKWWTLKSALKRANSIENITWSGKKEREMSPDDEIKWIKWLPLSYEMKKSDLNSRVEWLTTILSVFFILVCAGISWFYIILYPVALLWLYNVSRLIYTEWKESVGVIKILKRHWFFIICYFLLIFWLVEDLWMSFVNL